MKFLVEQVDNGFLVQCTNNSVVPHKFVFTSFDDLVSFLTDKFSIHSDFKTLPGCNINGFSK